MWWNLIHVRKTYKAAVLWFWVKFYNYITRLAYEFEIRTNQFILTTFTFKYIHMLYKHKKTRQFYSLKIIWKKAKNRVCYMD